MRVGPSPALIVIKSGRNWEPQIMSGVVQYLIRPEQKGPVVHC